MACQIEARLNSRPLTQLPESADGLEVLIPGHFLNERPLETLPDVSIDNLKAIHVLWGVAIVPDFDEPLLEAMDSQISFASIKFCQMEHRNT